MKQKSLRTQVNYSKIGIDKNQLSVNSRENSKTFPKIRGTALVTLNKVGGNPVSYNTPTWPLPTNTNVPKYTQNAYGMCYLHKQIYFCQHSFSYFIYLSYLFKKNRNKSKTWPLTTNKKKLMGLSFSVKLHLYFKTGNTLIHYGYFFLSVHTVSKVELFISHS